MQLKPSRMLEGFFMSYAHTKIYENPCFTGPL